MDKEASMEKTYRFNGAENLPTPALVFFEEIIRGNIKEAIRIAGSPGRLRPHVKTHKTLEISAMAVSMGIGAFKCATVSEAQMLAAAHAADVLLSYPLFGRNASRFAALAASQPGIKYSTIVDSPEGLAEIARAAKEEKAKIGVFLDLDIGQHRTGIAPGDKAVALYSSISTHPGLYPAGLHCYDGHNHQTSADERREAALSSYSIMDSVRSSLLALGLPVPEVVMGGTPTFPFYAEMKGVTLSPGTVFLQDYSYSTSFPDMKFKPAAIIVTRVVSRSEERKEFCIDLGYKGISADPKGLRGLLLEMPEAEPVLQNEEHWVFKSPTGNLLPLGSVVHVMPTHICPTVALYERAYVVGAEGEVSKEWKIAARDRVVEI
jgi:D-serine deaminase-like pyridoxal phosphate-dependent protein